MTDFKLVPLKEIKPDPNQPRKYYDETAMAELTDSVKEKGILQPILLRPNGKGLILVCGERRFKAATAAGLTEIPAVIRELCDEEALELQIIENLQRKDVHPMEEAIAFKSLLDKGKDTKDVAHRVGKSEYYVRQRVKLCSLSKDWQKVFFEGRVSITDALKVAIFTPNIQKEIFEEDRNQRGEIEVDDWTIRKYSGNLKQAAFDITDPKLDKKAGACVGCKFNSATAALFPDDESSPRCSNQVCFKNKTDQHFAKAFDIALEDPEVILVHESYSTTPNDKFITKARNAGKDVLGSMAYDKKTPEEARDYNGWLEDEYFDEETEEEIRKQYNEYLQECKKELDEFNHKVQGGKYKKAFVVLGDDRGKYIYITLTKGKAAVGSSVATKAKEEAGSLTVADIDAEITRLKDREIRSKEIDQNKIWEDLRGHFNPATNAPILTGEFTQLERQAIVSAIHDKVEYNHRDDFERAFNLKNTPLVFASKAKRNNGWPEFTDEQIRSMIRFFFLSVLPPSIIYRGFTEDTDIPLQLAKAYFPSVLEDIEGEVQEKANRRGEKVLKRIAELQAKKKELTTKPKPANKKK